MDSFTIPALPSSFVAKNMKLAEESGSGEAKLWTGPISKLAELDSFFGFDEGYTYSFSKDNLFVYLNQVKIEYVYQKFNKYKKASLALWEENYSLIESLNEDELTIHLYKVIDNDRYYIRADEDIFKKTFRNIVIPKLTNLVFEKDTNKKHINLKLDLNLEYKKGVSNNIKFNTGYKSKFSRNRIVFGAPGTGKSFTINKERKELLGSDNETDYERVTFHPDYSYANFVGTYKPIPSIDSEGKDTITYAYVPGPFMRVYVDALKNSREDLTKPYLLIIEEINRANVAAVFGDIFQLLDRKGDVSEYPIQASEDIKAYLAKELGGDPSDYSKIRVPDNMFIWATMNSADQGVFPMDTAFKRRWDFTYLGINDSDKDIQEKYVEVGSIKKQFIEWNSLRKAINDYLASEKINEDKQLGPYFISRDIVVPNNGDEIDSKKFCDVFKHKVLMYLFDDAAKQKRNTLFEECKRDKTRYSEICKGFDEQGIGIFNLAIQNQVKPRNLETDNIELDENGMTKSE